MNTIIWQIKASNYPNNCVFSVTAIFAGGGKTIAHPRCGHCSPIVTWHPLCAFSLLGFQVGRGRTEISGCFPPRASKGSWLLEVLNLWWVGMGLLGFPMAYSSASSNSAFTSVNASSSPYVACWFVGFVRFSLCFASFLHCNVCWLAGSCLLHFRFHAICVEFTVASPQSLATAHYFQNFGSDRSDGLLRCWVFVAWFVRLPDFSDALYVGSLASGCFIIFLKEFVSARRKW